MLKEFFQQHGLERTYWIAYSGGLDSHVLLSLCHAVYKEQPIKLRVIHVNHHLSPYSNIWSRHCEKICLAMGIDFVEKNIYIDLKNGGSLEELARKKRYAAFADLLLDGNMLLTAHHQDDQAETVLLQLVRGAGPKGLAAMPALKPFARGMHARPLLGMTRTVLQQYANEHSLKWIEDESNHHIKHTRNFIRHDVLPTLAVRWPTVAKAISRSALHCAESQRLLEEFALDLLKNLHGSNNKTLSAIKLLSLDNARQRLILRAWIHAHGFPLPDTKKMRTICHDVLTAGRDRTPHVTWEGVELRRYRDDLYLMASLIQHDKGASLPWEISQPLILTGIGILSAKPTTEGGLKMTTQHMSVRFRQGGETLRLPGRGGRHTLKNLFQEWDIPTWERDRLPLLFAGDQCVGVVGHCIDVDHMAKQGETGYQPHLERY